MNRVIQKQKTYKLNSPLKFSEGRKRKTITQDLASNIADKNGRTILNDDDEDFSVCKSNISIEKKHQRYSRLATLLTEEEVEKFKLKITKELNHK